MLPRNMNNDLPLHSKAKHEAKQYSYRLWAPTVKKAIQAFIGIQAQMHKMGIYGHFKNAIKSLLDIQFILIYRSGVIGTQGTNLHLPKIRYLLMTQQKQLKMKKDV